MFKEFPIVLKLFFAVAVASGAAMHGIGVPHLEAQERSRAALPPGVCEIAEGDLTAEADPPAERVARAEELAAEASQAAILGDDARALELLQEAALLDPGSASILYRLGRLLEGADQGRAVTEYCRYLALTPDGPEADEVRDRIDRMAGPFDRPVEQEGITEEARAEAEERRRAEERAEEEERRRAEARAEAEEENRRAAEERTPAERVAPEFEAPPAPDDPAREGDEGGEEGAGPLTPTPATVLVTGMLLPGMGHIYAGQPETGLVVLGAAAASVGAGLLYRRLEVQCLVLPVGGECPDGQERGRTESRPLLGPGVAIAAVVTIGGAIHAYLSARDSSPRFSTSRAGAGGETTESATAVTLRGVQTTLLVEPSFASTHGGVRAGLKVRF